jgi:type II secretory pathway predicted ATPase ExeA/cell division septation protein DedD
MFKDFYHLKTEPFSTHPNPGIIFISDTHKEAWYYLLFGIDTQEPFLVLTGEYGMGKTLLCLRLIQVLKKQGKRPIEYVPAPNEGYGGILRRIASRLEISPIPEDEGILQDMIYGYFRSDAENIRFYLIIDDAHELSTETLTKLKHLSTFSHNGVFPIIMIFIAHPSFLKDHKTPAINSLNQRIKRRYHLSRFSFEDTKNYIYFRLLKSGALGVPAFPGETLQNIYEYSGGVPRLINNICDTCLLIGASRELRTIPPDVVDEARKLVEGSLTEINPKTEDDIQPGSKDAARTFITISEDIPAVDQETSLSMLSDDLEEFQPEKSISLTSGFGKIRKAAIITAIVILMILSGAALSRYFMDDAHIPAFFPLPGSQKEQTIPANQPAQQPPEAVKVQTIPQNPSAQTEKNIAQVPTLREELIDKPSAGIPVAEVRSEAVRSESVEAPQQPAAGMDNPPTYKAETVSSGSAQVNAFHPFSLKSSSYQQPDRALAELSEIRQLGLAPYLVKVNLGDMGVWWRIYIGLYATEEEARSILKTYKLSNVTVQRTDYACQVGEYSNETDILNMFGKLRQSGYFPYTIQKDRNRFRLYLGAYEKKSEAEALHQELQKKGINSLVVKR